MQSRNVTMRQAGEADLPGVLALYAQPEIDDGVVLDLDAARALFQRFATYPSYRLFVADDDGAIVGSYALLIMDDLGHLGAPSAIVEDVVVDPARHGRGIGQTMMRHAMQEARARHCYKLALSSNATRERAHAFYEALGFRRHGYSFLIELGEGSTP